MDEQRGCSAPVVGVMWVVLEEFTTGGGFPLVAFDDHDTAKSWADKQPATWVTKEFKVIPLALNPPSEHVLANGKSVWRLFIAPKRIDVERRPASDVSYVYASQEAHSDENEDERDHTWPRIVFVFAVDESEAIHQALEMRRRWMGWGE